MKKPHTKARGILFAAAGMFLIPGSVSEVSAAERKDEQPFIQASGIESVLEKCYETEVKDNINLYLVPTEEGEYLNMAFSDTKEFTYIRNAPDDSGDWVGKLYKDSAAQVLEYLDGWTKIRSGSAEGYVPEDALFTGEEAQARAQEYEKDTVTVTAYVLNVREGCGTDSKILTQIKKGEVYETVGEATGGWYPVKVGDKSGWVSGDYVIAETSYSYGETKEEEEKRIAEEEAQEKMAASVVCGADGRPGTRPVGAVSQGRVNTPSQAPGTPGHAQRRTARSARRAACAPARNPAPCRACQRSSPAQDARGSARTASPESGSPVCRCTARRSLPAAFPPAGRAGRRPSEKNPYPDRAPSSSASPNCLFRYYIILSADRQAITAPCSAPPRSACIPRSSPAPCRR